jgi:hypothetical protein
VIIFVTGVSTAGKTTLYQALRKDPDLTPYIEFHDIDEDGVPRAGSVPWRHFRVELLLHEAVARFRDEGKHTVICGVTKPHEAIESGSFPEDIPVHFIMIEVSLLLLKRRMTARVGDRVSADDLEWLIQMNRGLSNVLRKSVQQQRNGVIVNPAGMSKVKVRQQVKALIVDLCEIK